MRQVYSALGNNIEVKPLFFSPGELDAAAFLSLMAVNSSDSAPLYMQIVLVRKPVSLEPQVADPMDNRGFCVNLAMTTVILHL